MIRIATENDIDAVEKSYVELLTYEKETGSSSNWVLGVYPTRAIAEESYKKGTLYVLIDHGLLCASMILNQVQPGDYRNIDWAYPALENEILVVHTLCVPPSQAGKGYGKTMMQYAMKKAREWHCKAVRLDTFAGNTPAAGLYRTLGFRYAGKASVLLQGLIPEEQIFFEKKIL